MPITQISFGLDDKDSPTPGGEDVHVLRGQSTGELRDRVWVVDADDDHRQSLEDFRAANGDDVVVEFRPVFRATDAGAEFVNFGIHVNKETGKVSVDGGTPPASAPANFIVEAVVTRNVGGIAPAALAPGVLRVHVHGSVDRIRLTPDTLTIRDPTGDGRINTRYAFTVRAWFDDGTVGDVTFSPELALWEPERFFRPKTPPGGTRRITIPADALIPRRVPVTITTSMEWGVHSASGTIDLREPWEITPDLPRAEWIDGHPQVLDGTLKPERVANVLFLAGGCADANRGAFVQLTGLLVHHLKVDPLLQPYGHLAGSMNFWRLALPGQPGGISVRGEVVPFTRENRLFARLLDAPVRPPATGKWKLEHLLYMAGLPVPADVRLVRDRTTGQPLQSADDVRGLDADEIDFERLEQKWSAMMRATPARNVSHTVMRKWLQLVSRTFVDEVDGFPALAIGLPPSARFDDSGSLAFHDLRGGIAECRTFLANVSAAPHSGRAPITLGDDTVLEDEAPSTALGNLWGSDLSNTAAFDNRWMLAMVCHVPKGRGRWSRDVGLFFRLYPSALGLSPRRIDTEFPGIPVAPNATGDGLAFAPLDPLLVPLADTWRSFAHELSHAFGLGDEYVDHAAVYTGDETTLDRHANLCTEASILGAGGALLVNEIKWNWNRVLFATMVTGVITPAGSGRFVVPVLPVPNFRIAAQNVVFLRERDPQLVIGRDTVTAGPFDVESVSAANDRVTIRAQSGTPDVDPFFPNGILYMPVPGLSSGTFHRLVSPGAARIMQVAIKGTMTGKICKTAEQADHGGKFTQVPAGSDPVGRVSAKDLPGLVGAYFGGKQYACGIVHPAGQCMMRNSHDATTAFCAVCRYVLVEQIDPTRHALVDRDYAKRYPL